MLLTEQIEKFVGITGLVIFVLLTCSICSVVKFSDCFETLGIVYDKMFNLL
jgi:hypothetical protein